ncbi:MAG: hypothetical protein LBK28_06715, partial [Propionibacteriaceae bacterium]|nr:hypothetical protein [Propionibacteriaceae bacterium]
MNLPRYTLLAALAAALALPLSLISQAPPPSWGAYEVNVPQAPVFPVIAKTETLPFTLDGGGDIEVAVLTGDLNATPTTWTKTSQLALSSYNNKTIRVLARASGEDNPANYFDATYRVRDTYSPGPTFGNDTNPAEALTGSATFKSWATGSTSTWSDIEKAIGPVKFSDDLHSGSTDVAILGNGGTVTMTFDTPIADGPGYDFAVFENGFYVDGTNLLFGELGRIQVSSNGTDFVEFDSACLWNKDIWAYTGIPAENWGGMAGRDPNSWGTPFDLSSLKNKPEVRSGDIDLNNITQVKVLDVIGDGRVLDSFGRGIYDPTYSGAPNGFDLAGIGVVNQARVTLTQPTAKAGTPKSSGKVDVEFTTYVTANGQGPVELGLEFDGASFAGQTLTKTSSADAFGEKITVKVTDMTLNTSYKYRFVGTQSDETEVATTWQDFRPSSITITMGSPSATHIWGTDTASVTVSGRYNPRKTNDQYLHVEYMPVGGAEVQWSEPQLVSGSPNIATTFTATVSGLEQRTTYQFRVVLQDETTCDSKPPVKNCGARTEGSWFEYTTYYAPTIKIGKTTITRVDGDTSTDTPTVTASLFAELYTGNAGNHKVRIEYANANPASEPAP